MSARSIIYTKNHTSRKSKINKFSHIHLKSSALCYVICELLMFYYKNTPLNTQKKNIFFNQKIKQVNIVSSNRINYAHYVNISTVQGNKEFDVNISRIQLMKHDPQFYIFFG